MEKEKGIKGKRVQLRDGRKRVLRNTRLVEVCRVCGTKLERGDPRCYVAGYLLCQDCLDMALNYLEGQIKKAKEVRNDADN